MFNKVVIVGHLTRDVELRYIPTTGSPIVTIGVACSRKFKRKDGNIVEEVCFVDAKFIGRLAEVINQYLKKGSKILIEGRLVYETWTDQAGAKKSRHIIMGENMQMLDSKPQDGQQQEQSTQQYETTCESSQGAEYHQPNPEINIDDDEIPF